MSKAIRASITETFGFEPVCINSALVSAQNRQRLYWVGRRNENGTYDRVYVEHPEDRGILLKDILEGATPVNVTNDSKARTVKAGYYKQGMANFITNSGHDATGVAGPVRVGSLPRPNGELSRSQAFRIYDTNGKSVNITSGGGGAGGKTGLYAVCVAQRGRYTDIGNRHTKGNGPVEQYYEAREDGKTNAITTVSKDNNIAEPCLCCIQDTMLTVKETTKQGVTEINPGDCFDFTQPTSKTRRGRNMKDKSNCLMTSCELYQFCGRLGYASPCEWDSNGRPTKAISFADGKTYTVYEVKDGLITIKEKQYPIKLADEYYIIRKLTVKECMRLQTVPEWFEFPVSDTQAYKCLGNGWTVDVIKHLITSALNPKEEANKQLTIF